MKLYRVITERDGAKTKAPGKLAETEVQRFTYFYAAETIGRVWDEIAWLRDDQEVELIAVIQEVPGLSVLAAAQEKQT